MKRSILALAALGTFVIAQAAAAQDFYPNRLIELVVPFAAGGNTDVVARVTAAFMQKTLTRTWLSKTAWGPEVSLELMSPRRLHLMDTPCASAAWADHRFSVDEKLPYDLSRISLRSVWSTPIHWS